MNCKLHIFHGWGWVEWINGNNTNFPLRSAKLFYRSTFFVDFKVGCPYTYLTVFKHIGTRKIINTTNDEYRKDLSATFFRVSLLAIRVDTIG